MSYQSAIAALFERERFGIKLGLDAITALLESIGNPHRQFKAVHIAGTNGKGSTAAILASILNTAGHRPGLYTSPHLIDFAERIRTPIGPITHQQVEALIETITAACPPSIHPTFFEFATAIAFRHFADIHTEIAVIEVGMGGRFDATNVVNSLVTIITNIEADHQEYLGKTIAEIAHEKCGIIRPHAPTIVGNASPQAMEVIRRRCTEEDSPLFQLGVDFNARVSEDGYFDYQGWERLYPALQCALQGQHQIENAACALAAVECLANHNIPIAEEQARAGLRFVAWPGRLECIARHPTVLLDGAHNPAAAGYLAAFLVKHRHANTGKLILVMGMQNDKDPGSFFIPLVPLADTVILTRSTHKSSASPAALVDHLPVTPMTVITAASAEEAMQEALRGATPEDTICVTGSLLLVGEVKAHVQGATYSPIRG